MPPVSMDHMGLIKREPEECENPIILIADRKTKVKYSNVIKNKGNQDQSALRRVALDIAKMGYGHFVFESDQEPAILSSEEECRGE